MPSKTEDPKRTMRPLRMLRNFSLKFLRSPIVVPLPIPSLFNQKLSQVLESQDSRGGDNLSTAWLLHAFESSIATQKIAQECLATVICRDSDRDTINNYLEDSIELLDGCNNLLEKMDVLLKYVKSLQVVLHLLEACRSEPPFRLVRAKETLDVCLTLERKCRDMNRCNRRLKRLNDKLVQREKSHISCTNSVVWFGAELDEILNGTLSLVSVVCEAVNVALSFKFKYGISLVQKTALFELQKKLKEETLKQKRGGSIFLLELRRTVKASHLLREQIKSQNYGEICETVEELKTSSAELDEGIRPFEGKVKELYRDLISFRVALLGILSSL